MRKRVDRGDVQDANTRTCSRATRNWRKMPVPAGDTYRWDASSTYVKNPPYFEGMTTEPEPPSRISIDARVLALLGDSITTDHISPAGSIKPTSRRAAT